MRRREAEEEDVERGEEDTSQKGSEGEHEKTKLHGKQVTSAGFA